jgi:hypothetical protein
MSGSQLGGNRIGGAAGRPPIRDLGTLARPSPHRESRSGKAPENSGQFNTNGLREAGVETKTRRWSMSAAGLH